MAKAHKLFKIPLSRTEPADGELLRYDSSTKLWTPAGKIIQPTSYTPTVTQMNNNMSSVAGFYYRIASRLFIDVMFKMSGAGSAAALTVSLPTIDGVQPLIDTSKHPGGTSDALNDPQGASVYGLGQWRDAGLQFEPIEVMHATTSTVYLNENAQVLFGNQLANLDSIKFTAAFHIVGWS